MRPRPLVPLVVALALGAAALPGSAAGRASGPRWERPSLVSDLQAARETSIALDPTDTRRQFVCDPSGVPDVVDGQSYFHRSKDGGRTWRYTSVETSPTDTRKAAFEGGDCDVAYDRGGTMYSADTWAGDLSVGHSTDHGETWAGTAVAVTSPVVDRPWLVGGDKGTVYLSYQDLQCCTPSAMWFQVSHDYGQTFTPATLVTSAQAGGFYTWEGNFVVGHGGQDVYLVYSRRAMPNQVVSGPGPESVWVAASHDGGRTWDHHLVAFLPTETTSIYPSIGLDAGGDLHVVWCRPDQAGDPVYYSASTERGNGWTPPVALNPGRTGWAPWVVGGRPGEAAVAWLDSADPRASSSKASDWYFGWAKVHLRADGHPTVTRGVTTTEPVYTGRQTVPEFEMLRLDPQGRMHLGMSVYRRSGGSDHWSVYAQSER